MLLSIAVINIFPTLTGIGDNMRDNFVSWGNKRIAEIPNDDKVAPENKQTDIGKLEDRLNKFKDKMLFLDKCRDILDEAKDEKDDVTQGDLTSKVSGKD